MKILLDENLPLALRHEFPGHEIFTVEFMHWKGVKNGRLLAAAAKAGFEVLLTIDKVMANEQALSDLPLAILVIDAKSNALNELHVFVPIILVALNHLKPKAVTHVNAPS